MIVPNLLDLYRLADDLQEACDIIRDMHAPCPELMDAERMLTRSLAMLRAHIEALLDEGAR